MLSDVSICQVPSMYHMYQKHYTLSTLPTASERMRRAEACRPMASDLMVSAELFLFTMEDGLRRR